MQTVSGRLRTMAIAAVSALVLVAGACDTDPGAPPTPALDQAEAEALALVVTADLEALPAGAAYDPAANPPSFAAPAQAPDFGWECVTREPDPAPDTDQDGVPDFVRLTYSGCVGSRPTFTVEVDGVIEISDQQPALADHSIRWVAIDFTRAVTNLIRGGTITTVENGTRLISASASVLEHELVDFTSDITFANGSTATHEKDWATTFTADVAESIARRRALPSGTWEIDGRSAWTHGERSSSLEVSTVEPLHYNAACTQAPKYDAGELVIQMTRGDRTSTVTIEYTACGQYTVTRS